MRLSAFQLQHQAQQMRALYQTKQLALQQRLQSGQLTLAQAHQVSQIQQVRTVQSEEMEQLTYQWARSACVLSISLCLSSAGVSIFTRSLTSYALDYLPTLGIAQHTSVLLSFFSFSSQLHDHF